jgi:hypothetical protein
MGDNQAWRATRAAADKLDCKPNMQNKTANRNRNFPENTLLFGGNFLPYSTRRLRTAVFATPLIFDAETLSKTQS